MKKTFSIITARTIKQALSPALDEVYNIIRSTYMKFGNNEAINPPSYFLKFPDKPNARIIALPALIKDYPRIAGIKWISSNPDNLNHNLKRASAVIILNDYETGYPLACLEGGIISSYRTVYSAILAADLLQKKPSNIGIIGAGNIAKEFINAIIARSWNIKTVRVFDSNLNAALHLKSQIQLGKAKINLKVCKSYEDVITASELIFLSTTTQIPYINDFSIFEHNPIILNISLRDLSPEVIVKSYNFVDDIQHVLSANTSLHLTQQKYNNIDFINCSIFELINGYKGFSDKKPVIFSPMGMGILDLALASFIYDSALRSKELINIKNFFNDEN